MAAARGRDNLGYFQNTLDGDWPRNRVDAGTRGPEVLGRIGNLETRLAANDREVRMAQALRFEVFCNEMSARIGLRSRLSRLERDRWDRICDHLIVLDLEAARPRAVATYRLLTGDRAKASGMGFYSQSEFKISSLTSRYPKLRFLELGRSCVLNGWRSKRTIELLWHGSWSYVRRHGIDVMFGCASFPGTDPQTHAEALSFLRSVAAPDPEWQVYAQSGRAASYCPVAPENIDRRRALASLPPLIKGYLRLGAWIGTEPVVDEHFETTDVMIILPVNRISQRYVSYYGHDAQRHAADRNVQSAL
jgi:L-ornithine Nalpha-acyltransferase